MDIIITESLSLLRNMSSFQTPGFVIILFTCADRSGLTVLVSAIMHLNICLSRHFLSLLGARGDLVSALGE